MMRLQPLTSVLLLVLSISAGCDGEKPDERRAVTQEPTNDNGADRSKSISADELEADDTQDTVDLQERHLWEDRVILLFAPDTRNADYRQMATELADVDTGVEDRKLVVYHLFRDEDGRVADDRLTPGVAKQLRSQYGVAPDAFTYLLLGLDSGEKMRSEEAVSPDKIFETIDQMPMRQRELRRESTP